MAFATSQAARWAAAIAAAAGVTPQQACGRLASSTRRNSRSEGLPAAIDAARRLLAIMRERRGEMRMPAPFNAVTAVVT